MLASATTIELRCSRHLHARLDARVIEIRCHQCSSAASRAAGEVVGVYHRFDPHTGELLDELDCHNGVTLYDSPTMVNVGQERRR